MTPGLLQIAVVGHTNSGKTSLLRTLTRSTDFGEVSDRPATTRHVEGAVLMAAGQPAVQLFDTPGLEDSIALLESLDAQPARHRADWPQRIQAFLDSPHGHGRFAQEAKSIRQVLACDAAVYVVDARDQVMAKHRDELEILSRCGKPVVPVLNFVSTPHAQPAVWREHLARAGLHAVAAFDTVVLDHSDEQRLFETIATLADRHRETIDSLIRERADHRRELLRGSCDLIADLLVDAAAYRLIVPISEVRRAGYEVERLKQAVRSREQQCVDQLLVLHRFRASDFQSQELPLTDGRWGADLFNPAAMKQFGVRTGGGAAAGALAGLTLDAMVGGMSLGAATAAGAAIGAMIGVVHEHGRRLLDRARGYTELRCDDATLSVLMLRQAWLLRALLRRGHASMQPIQADPARPQRGSANRQASVPAATALTRLPPELQTARLHPQWSRLAETFNAMALASPQRRAAKDAIAAAVQRLGTAGADESVA